MVSSPHPRTSALPPPQRLTIHALGGLADGIARLPSGEAVLVAGALPGDDATVRITSRAKGILRGEIAQLHQPSADRVAAPCSAFGQCGGCDLQHLALPAQAQHKLSWLQRALGRDAQGRPAVAAELADPVEPRGHRRRARLHLRPVGRGLGLGMLQARSDQLAFVSTCLALDPQLEALRKRVPAPLAQAIDTGELTAVVGRQGVIGHLSARPLPRVDPLIAQQINAQRLAEAWGLQGLGVHIGRFEDQWGLGEVDLPEVAGPLTVRVDARGFCQASPAANAQIRRILSDELQALGPFERIQEWYAGSGNLTGLLVDRAPRLRAIEGDLSACDRLQRSLNEAGVGHVDVICSPVEQALSPPRGRELWLLDPGRQGARELAEYAQMSPPDALIYVSCALDTLGRDLATLRQGGLRVQRAVLIDAFPWTVHAEAVVTLVRDAAAEASFL